ncbi:hypothetical protein [Pseudovibrio sp. Alg231-02]|uniref:hypothetical protein n=1 Tax=Pseudovibrio sp. Alg231-02 TaxID=1922223 RepID=UPI00131F347B|nr:hypothetical protein [Pseudovibrio sp. Alg231-02]
MANLLESEYFRPLEVPISGGQTNRIGTTTLKASGARKRSRPSDHEKAAIQQETRRTTSAKSSEGVPIPARLCVTRSLANHQLSGIMT